MATTPLLQPSEPAPLPMAVRRVRCGPLRWLVRDIAWSEALQPVLDQPEVYLRDPASRIKSSRVVTISRIPAPGKNCPNLILRRLNYGKLLHRLRDLFRPTRARRAFRHGLQLEQKGVRTARVLATVDVRRFLWPRTAYLVTEEVAGAETLASLFLKSRRLVRARVEQIARAIAHLHASSFSHRDLKWTNLLFDSQKELVLIDLDGVRAFREPNDIAAAGDLVVLAEQFLAYPVFLKFAGIRFLKTYCEARGMPSALRWFVRHIENGLRARARASRSPASPRLFG